MQPILSVAKGLPCAPENLDDFLSRPTDAVKRVLAPLEGPILVLGAGGKIGLHLSAMLQRGLVELKKSNRVIAVSRFSTLHGREDFAARGIDTLTCDLTDPAQLAALPEAQTLFFMAGVKFGTSTSPEILHAINADMPRRVADRFPRSRIVAFSTGCVYPFVPVDSGGATEATPTSAVGDYAASCIEREKAFIAASLKNETAVALVRLNYAVEFRYGLVLDIATRVWRNEPVDLTTGFVNAIWQGDAVAHCIQTLDTAGVPAAPINITGADTLAVRALALRLGTLLQRDVRFTGSEAPTAWLNNAAYSHGLFGLPPTSVDDILQWTAAWLIRGGETWDKPTGFQNRDGRF